MTLDEQEKCTVAEQAAQWLVVLQSAGPTENAAFMKWLKASPLHVHEMLVASRVREVLGAIPVEKRLDLEALAARAQSNSNISTIGTPLAMSAPTGKRRSFSWQRVVVAAVLLLTLAVGTGWFARERLYDGDTYFTKRGEQRVISLSDGSVVWLNTDSRMYVQYNGQSRDIVLEKGQALFQVQHDVTRPFRVHASSTVVQAVGTQFDVRLFDSHTLVAVVEGAVEVSSAESNNGSLVPAATSRVTAGESASIAADGLVEKTMDLDAKAVTAWRMQRLIFQDTPLVIIVSEFNRYNAGPRLRVEGEHLQARQFDGAFDALRPQSFLAYLESEGLVIERRVDEVVVREPALIATGSKQ